LAEPPSAFPLSILAQVCNDFAQSSSLEWLQTNHTGAFAMGTVAGVNTRRYHGLLIATLNPPADRISVFPRVEETVEFDGESFPLAAVQYPGIVTPSGFELLEEFSASPSPTWRFRFSRQTICKTLRLLDGQQTVVLTYQANAACRLAIRLFVSFRDYHSLAKSNSQVNRVVDECGSRLTMHPYANFPPIHFHHNALRFEADGLWFHDQEYLRDMERGLDFHEDLYSPGVLHFQLESDATVHLMATLEDTAFSIPPLEGKAVLLTQALDQFRVLRADKKPTLIAGYPWFTDWSRDTLISLPALIAAGFDPSETRAILDFLLAERKQGILPNRFSDRQSTPEYNTVDASLWFFVAADSYLTSTQDLQFLAQKLFPAALDIIQWHQQGTFYSIKVDASDHLLAAGEPGVQLTWMDAKIGDFVVTPRIGKPVEINALWFNALRITGKWASSLGHREVSATLQEEAFKVYSSFNTHFWNASLDCLFDVLTSGGPDASIRPNQLLAASLPYPLLDRSKARSMVGVVRQMLLTPVGLRTLAPSDPNYRPRFDGDMASRDSAYHQGTVWPWLIGPYVGACLYAFDKSAEAKRECRDALNSIFKLTQAYCLGSIGEVFDGDAPHHPGGCPAQLWSVAQTMLALQMLND
jgi:glycogen debranching enzyme